MNSVVIKLNEVGLLIKKKKKENIVCGGRDNVAAVPGNKILLLLLWHVDCTVLELIFIQEGPLNLKGLLAIEM